MGRAGIDRNHKPLNEEYMQLYDFLNQLSIYWDQEE